jgi:hypothetical protein
VIEAGMGQLVFDITGQFLADMLTAMVENAIEKEVDCTSYEIYKITAVLQFKDNHLNKNELFRMVVDYGWTKSA